MLTLTSLAGKKPQPGFHFVATQQEMILVNFNQLKITQNLAVLKAFLQMNAYNLADQMLNSPAFSICPSCHGY